MQWKEKRCARSKIHWAKQRRQAFLSFPHPLPLSKQQLKSNYVYIVHECVNSTSCEWNWVLRICTRFWPNCGDTPSDCNFVEETWQQEYTLSFKRRESCDYLFGTLHSHLTSDIFTVADPRYCYTTKRSIKWSRYIEVNKFIYTLNHPGCIPFNSQNIETTRWRKFNSLSHICIRFSYRNVWLQGTIHSIYNLSLH